MRLLFYLIRYDLRFSQLQTGTSEDGQFISLCINGQGHMEGKTAEGNSNDSVFFLSSLAL